MLTALLEIALKRDSSFPVNLNGYCKCGQPYYKLASDVVLIMTNIVLNNYTMTKNYKLSIKSNKRKLAILIGL